MANNKNHEVKTLGALLMSGRAHQSESTGEMPEMTAEEYRTFNDPAPGTDPSWDSLSESEKNYFRTPQRSMGKTFSDLMKDREALEMDAKATGLLTTEAAPQEQYLEDACAIEDEALCQCPKSWGACYCE